MKKTTQTLLVVALLFAGVQADAQSFTIGVKGGLSIPNLTAGSTDKTPMNTGYKSRLGPEAALFAEYKVSKLFSVEGVVQYSSQGGKKDGMQALKTPAEIKSMYSNGDAPQYLYANYKSEAKLNYVMVAALAKVGWDLGKSPLRLYIGVGPFVGFLVSAKQETSGRSAIYLDEAGQQALPGGTLSFDHTEDIKSDLHAVNFGVEGSLGLSYRIGRNNIFVEGGGNYGFLNIQKYSENGNNTIGAGTAVIGYSYRLGK
ncbi:MAG: PorT family protein [Bacteroidetes bacterium]|nr:PorT family protein [Bacteroidota bacterium]